MSKQPSGVVLIFITLIIGATALVATVTFARIGLSHLAIFSIENTATTVDAVARGCVDEVLIWTQKDTDFTETAITTNQGTCTVDVSYPQTNEITMIVSYTENEITRTYTITAEQDPFVLTSLTSGSE